LASLEDGPFWPNLGHICARPSALVGTRLRVTVVDTKHLLESGAGSSRSDGVCQLGVKELLPFIKHIEAVINRLYFQNF
jgi:hypothetical protein